MKRKILVIEDDPEAAHLAVFTLQQADAEFEIAQAADGKEGIEKALSFKPDLAVVDIMLPKAHGFQVCQKLKSHQSLRGIRILILTAKSYDADRESARRAGADDYLTKPYKVDDLAAKATALLAKQDKARGRR